MAPPLSSHRSEGGLCRDFDGIAHCTAPEIGSRSREDPAERQVAILCSAGRFPSDATAGEIAFGLEVSQRIGLDPWLGQVKFLRFEPTDKIHTFVGIDGMRALAERSGKYQTGAKSRLSWSRGLTGRRVQSGPSAGLPEGLEPSVGRGGPIYRGRTGGAGRASRRGRGRTCR